MKEKPKVTISLDDLNKLKAKPKKSKVEKPKLPPKSNKGYIGKRLGNGKITKVADTTLPSSIDYKLVETNRGNKYILSVEDLNKQIK